MNRNVIDLSSDDEPSAKKFKLSDTIIVLDDEDDITEVFDHVADLRDFNEAKPKDLDNNCKSGDCPPKARDRAAEEDCKPQTEPEKDADIRNGHANEQESGVEQEDECLLQVLGEERFEQENTALKNEATANYTDATAEDESSRLPDAMENFLQLCEESIKSKAHILQRKLSKVRYRAQLATKFIATKAFVKQLHGYCSEIKEQPTKASDLLAQVYVEIKQNADMEENSDDANKWKVERLEMRLMLVAEAVEKYAEDTNSEDEDTSYVKYNRYMQKANQLHDKICQLKGCNPNAGIPYFTRLDFNKSAYNEFNIALSKQFRNRRNRTFPIRYDVHKCLKKCAKEKKIRITEAELKVETERCFLELVKLLKKRRIRDMDFVLSAHLPSFDDPAKKDPELDRQIRENYKLARNRESEVLDLYVMKQNEGEEPQLSADSDDSHHPDESSSDEHECAQ